MSLYYPIFFFLSFSCDRDYHVEIERYHFLKTDTDIFNFFNRYLANRRYSIGYRYRYSKIFLPIYLRYFNKVRYSG